MSRRIVLLTLAVTSLVVLAFLVPLLSLVRDVAAARETTYATGEAQSTAALVGVDDDTLAATLSRFNAGAGGRRTTVFGPGTEVRGAAAARDAAVDAVAAGQEPVTVEVPGGRAVLVPVLLERGQVAVVRTFVPAAALRTGVGRASTALVVLGLALLAAAAGVAWLLGRSLVRPLLSVAGTADTLRAGDLSARAAGTGTAEVVRIAGALDGLAARITELLQAEREAAADLSHRLRTPLTALRLDAEGLRDPEEAERILAAADALERMVSHVITQARRPGGRRADAAADAAAVARERVTFWSALAEEQERPVRQDIPAGPVPVPVAADELAAALDALLGNVLAHTPVGTGFSVRVLAAPVPAVEVTDAGPGIADATLLDRGRSGGASTGLGLDIARRTAEDAGGRLELSSGPAGLRATLWLGPLPDPAAGG